MKRSPRVNWAFVPLLVFIAIRGYLQEGWLYPVAVIGAGLLVGLFLRRREQRQERHTKARPNGKPLRQSLRRRCR